MKKIIKITNILLFTAFILFLLYLTLFKNFVGRTEGTYDYNLIPFKNIIGITASYIKGKLSFAFFLRNIFGNIIAFAPFAYFLKTIFKINNIKEFTIIMLLIIITIESLQLILRIGVFDIDDVILNLTGTLVLFQILAKNKYLRQLTS